MTSKTCFDSFFYIYRKSLKLPLLIGAVLSALMTNTFFFYFSESDFSVQVPEFVDFFSPVMDEMYMFITLMLCCLAGCAVFINYTVSRPCNVLFSLGISRRAQYTAKYLAGLTGLVLFFIVYSACILGTIFRYSSINNAQIPDAAILLVSPLLCYTLGYTISCFAFANSTHPVAGFVWTAIAGVSTVFFQNFACIFDSLSFGSPFAYMEQLLLDGGSKYGFLSPFIEMESLSSLILYDRPGIAVKAALPLFTLGLTVLVFLLGFIGFRRKTADDLGRIFCSRYIYKVMSVPAGFLAADVAIGVIRNRAAASFTAVAACFAVMAVIALVFVRKKSAFITAAITAAVCAALCLTANVRDYKLPERNEIETVTVSGFPEQPSLDTEEYKPVYFDLGFEANDETPHILSTAGDIDDFYAVHSEIISKGLIEDESGSESRFPVYISYQMKNGEEKDFYYEYISDDCVKEICSFKEDTDSVSEASVLRCIPVLDKDMNFIGIIANTDSLAAALEKDAANRTGSEFLSPAEEKAVISLNNQDWQLDAAANYMWKQMTESKKKTFAGDYDNFRAYFGGITGGYIPLDEDGDGYFESSDTAAGSWGMTSESGFIDIASYGGPLPKEVVEVIKALKKAAEMPAEELAEYLADYLFTCEFTGNTVITADMKNTLAVIEKELVEISPVQRKYTGVWAMPFDKAYEFVYNANSAINVVSVLTSGAASEYFLKPTNARYITDAAEIGRMLENSTVRAPLKTKDTEMYIFIFEDGSMFAKFSR